LSRGGRLASLYIHIPFCAKRCRYCDFYSLPAGGDYSRIRIDDSVNDYQRINNRYDTNNVAVINQYIDAVIKEWDIYESAGMLDRRGIDTIYIGGGTPSILDVDTWERLDKKMFSRIDRTGIKEWSIECNPESFNMDKARAYSKSGVTRLTFGIQSLNDRELSLCGRAHNSARALDVLRDGRLAAMFDSTGVDIIYGLPGQTIDTLNATLSPLLSIRHIKHLSAYELTIAEETPFGRHGKILPRPDEDTIADMYRLIGNRCAERGMGRYEVSNYAIDGYESVHNKAYWSHKPYTGLGASAHSYIHPRRRGNVCDVNQYISLLSSGRKPVDFEEVLTNKELAEEMVFLGLRNTGGIDKREFEARTGRRLCDAGSEKEARLREYVETGLLIDSGEALIPTSKGMLFADMMALGIIQSPCFGN
jgi:oxygen-independent coproporphyrinogen-3 oxidase